jgi:hypothetical protein
VLQTQEDIPSPEDIPLLDDTSQNPPEQFLVQQFMDEVINTANRPNHATMTAPPVPTQGGARTTTVSAGLNSTEHTISGSRTPPPTRAAGASAVHLDQEFNAAFYTIQKAYDREYQNRLPLPPNNAKKECEAVKAKGTFNRVPRPANVV